MSILDAGYAAETAEGMQWVRPLDTLMEVAKNAGGANCPRCGHHCKLFFGDPNGDHWCVCCQMNDELRLTKEA